MSIIKSFKCIETTDGVLLVWELIEGVTLRSAVVRGTNDNRQFVIKSPLITTGRCLINNGNGGLCSSFKLTVTDTFGRTDESTVVNPVQGHRPSNIILKEIRRRERAYMKAHPYGAFPFTILLRKQFANRCPLCSPNSAVDCIGSTDHAVSPKCPVCVGTGLENPYIVLPDKEYMLAVTPKEDKTTGGAEGIKRLDVIRVFKTVSEIRLREEDVIVTATEAYIINEQEVISSVGNTPAVYKLVCAQLMPEDPRYPALMSLVKGA